MLPILPFCLRLILSFFLLQVPPGDTLREGLRLQSEGNFLQAAERFREVLKADPSLTEVHSNLGFVLSKLGQYEEAAAEYREVLSAKPHDFGVGLNLALSLYKMGRFDAAAGQLQALRTAQPENEQVTMLLADCWLRLGQNQRVIDLLRPIERADEQNLGVAYVLGTALIREKQVAEGQKLVDRILARGESAEAHYLLGTQMAAAGDFPAAVTEFGKAVRINPSLPSLQSAYGQALLTTGDPDAAAAAFRKELQTNSADFDANLSLGEINQERGDYLAAEPLLRRALQIRPDSFEARLAVGDLAFRQQRYDEARATLEKLSSQFPDSAAAHQKLSAVYTALHDPRAAQESARAARTTSASAPKGNLEVGTVAPDFTLPNPKTGRRVRLAELAGKGPVLLVLGSYTCPNFRQAAGTLNQFYRDYGNRMAFYMVYIREAHAEGSWQSGRNQREKISLQPATDMAEKMEHAALCTRKLNIDFPALVDGMDGAVETRYSGWPSHVYVIGRDGRIAYTSGLAEFEFHPAELKAVLAQVNAKTDHARVALHP